MSDSRPRSIRRTLVRNTAFNAAGRLWEAAANLVLAAYIVSRLGLPIYGLWGLMGVFTGYVALLDFGMGSGYTKYIAEHAARGERERLSHVVSTGFFFYLALGVALVCAGWICVDPLIDLVARFYPAKAADWAESTLVNDVRVLLRGSLILFAVSNCLASFAAIQSGLQRMGITNAISFCASLLKVAATVVFLETGFGVRGLLYANAVVLAFFGGASIACAFFLIPGLRVSPWAVDRDTLGRLFSFGWRSQVTKLSNLITFQTDKAVIGLVAPFLGLTGASVVLARIGAYRLGEELASKMRQAPALMLSAVIPAASDLDARGDDERLRRLYLLSSKYVAVATMPLVGVFVGCAGMMMRAWMGEKEGLDVAVWVLRILALGYLANIIPGAAASIALGKGRPDVQMKAGLIAMASNIICTLLLVFAVGFYGIALGTAVSMTLSCAWFIRAMRPLVNVSARELTRTALVWPALCTLPGMALCVLADYLGADLVGRMPNLALLAGCSAALGLSYALLIPRTPFLDAFDVDFLANALRLRLVPGFAHWRRWVERG